MNTRIAMDLPECATVRASYFPVSRSVHLTVGGLTLRLESVAVAERLVADLDAEVRRVGAEAMDRERVEREVAAD